MTVKVPPRYTVSGLIKGAAPIEEMRTLVRAWQPGESGTDLAKRVVAAGVLGKATSAWARDLVVRVFRPRLLLPTDTPARHLQVLLAANAPNAVFSEALWWYEARAENLLFDFVCQAYWPARHAGAIWMLWKDVLAFLDQARDAGKLERAWSDSTRERVASAVLKALTTFGYLGPDRGAKREILPYRLSDLGLAFVAHALHFDGEPDSLLVEHHDWALFGLDRAQVLDRLELLSPAAGLLIQRAGSVVHLNWQHTSMEALIHALTA